MSADDDFLLNADPDYDGQGKSRGEEVEGTMMMLALVLGYMFIVAMVIGLLIWI